MQGDVGDVQTRASPDPRGTASLVELSSRAKTRATTATLGTDLGAALHFGSAGSLPSRGELSLPFTSSPLQRANFT